MIPLKKTSTNIIVGLTSMAFFVGFAGYTNHYDLTKKLPTVNSAPAEITRQEVQSILSKAEPVVAKAGQRLPLTSAKSPALTAPVTVSPPVAPEPAAAPPPTPAPQVQVAPQQAPTPASPPGPIVVAKADTTQAPAPSKAKTTKTRAS